MRTLYNRTFRKSIRSRGLLTNVFVVLSGLVLGSCYVLTGNPIWGVLTLAAFAVSAVMAFIVLIQMLWTQGTSERKSALRFHELYESLERLSEEVQQPLDMTRVSNKQEAAHVIAPLNDVTPGASREAVSNGVSSVIQTASGVKPKVTAVQQKQVVPTKTVGRQAAAVQNDDKRQLQILERLGVLSNHSIPNRRPIFALVGQELSEQLKKSYSVEALLPSTISAQIATYDGSALIVDDNAFLSGTWFGADSASGTLLANELFRAIDDCRKREIPTYFVRSRRGANIYTVNFESESDIVVSDETLADWSEDFEFKLLGVLTLFVKMKRGISVG